MKDLPERGGSENRGREERKRIIEALRVVLALKINYLNNNLPHPLCLISIVWLQFVKDLGYESNEPNTMNL